MPNSRYARQLANALTAIEPFAGFDVEDALEVGRVLQDDHGLRLITKEELRRLNLVVEAAQLHIELPTHRATTLKFVGLAIESWEDYAGRPEVSAPGGQAEAPRLRHEGRGQVNQDDAATDHRPEG